jgi:serine/threonine protein phosphatase PrpC
MTYIQSKIGSRSENQDFYSVTQTQQGELIVVCDGMGGYNGGGYASKKAVQIIIEEISKSRNKDATNTLKDAIQNANSAIWQDKNLNSSLKGMGTTIVALLLTPEKAVCCHVGDSRLYQIREGKILHRTFDHSHVFEMVRAGLINEEQARLSEKSNIITRALGMSPTVDIDITDLSYKKGDRFLLCTDGIWGLVPENELVKMASKKGKIEWVLNELVDKIDAIGSSKKGGYDNLTAALTEIEYNSNFESIQNKKKERLSFLKFLKLSLFHKSTPKK